MRRATSSSGAKNRPVLPASFPAVALLPFFIPILLTLLLVLTVGEGWPRNLAAGAGLKLPGLIVAGAVATLVWRRVVRAVDDGRARRFAGLLCAVTGLMSWPVWTVGVLPSLNGAMPGETRSTTMQLERLDITRPSKGNGYYHWAVLRAARAGTVPASGRYFIPEHVYRQWNARRPATVTLVHARGALGAEVVTAYR